MSPAAKDPFDTWQRSVRRALRDYARDSGQVPSLFGAVSRGANTHKVESLPRLDLLPDAKTVREHLSQHASRFLSRFAAVAQLKDHPDPSEAQGASHVLLLSCLTIDRTACWVAPANARGILGWDRKDFRHGDIEPIRDVLWANAEVAL
jgi:hypothetical protein